tara:strand:+ start:1422 stop:2129 length:708 start_codon:yes stop_codon:yes gene_type:complete
MIDLLGNAIYNYHFENSMDPLTTWTSYTDKETLSCDYFFRKYNEMPIIEKKALDLSEGEVLDVGSGAGCHSLYLQKNKKIKVTSIDVSKKCVEVSKSLGLIHTINKSFFNHNNFKYDTILFLMNGVGICGTVNRLKLLLDHSISLLKENGQILLDSSDLIYLFDKDKDGGVWVRGDKYYGELSYSLNYRNQEENFPWLFIGYEKLKEITKKSNLKCEKIIDGQNYDYLARITKEY